MYGVIVAEEKELDEALKILSGVKETTFKGKVFYEGKVGNKEVVIVRSSIGKVNSALTCQMLIDKYDVKMVFNIGSSGSVDNSLDIGDVVVASKLVQHDFDVTGFGRQLGEIEGIGIYI